MHSFSNSYLCALNLPTATSWFLGCCMEARGKQQLWLQSKQDILEALRETAIIQSSESSNRIEGVTVEHHRLVPLLQGKVKPRDRSEEELFGYRKALDWIHSEHSTISISPDIIRHLHLLAQSGFSGDAGEWKKRNNEIIEIRSDGSRVVRFIPVEPHLAPEAVNQLCLGFREVLTQQTLPDAIAIAAFVFDFLCIHPFRDGNGRVSRLITLLLLYQSGYTVGRYVSLERIVEGSKEDYYSALQKSSIDWHDAKHDIIPFFNYFLGHIRTAYLELEQRVSIQGTAHLGKGELVRQAILDHYAPFHLHEIVDFLKTVSPQLVKKILAQLKKEGKVKLTGRGRGARWNVVRKV